MNKHFFICDCGFPLCKITNPGEIEILHRNKGKVFKTYHQISGNSKLETKCNNCKKSFSNILIGSNNIKITDNGNKTDIQIAIPAL